ncbi:MAG: GNAT family N-acetyltransferase [Thermomicrobiales bacterium]
MGDAYPLQERLLRQNMDDNPNFQPGDALLAWDGDALVGFTLLQRYRGEEPCCKGWLDYGWVAAVAVAPEHQRRHIGTRKPRCEMKPPAPAPTRSNRPAASSGSFPAYRTTCQRRNHSSNHLDSASDRPFTTSAPTSRRSRFRRQVLSSSPERECRFAWVQRLTSTTYFPSSWPSSAATGGTTRKPSSIRAAHPPTGSCSCEAKPSLACPGSTTPAKPSSARPATGCRHQTRAASAPSASPPPFAASASASRSSTKPSPISIDSASPTPSPTGRTWSISTRRRGFHRGNDMSRQARITLT